MPDDDDAVFRALADPTRRLLLDRLFERDGRTLTELESQLEMTRFGVMKHLRILEGRRARRQPESGPREAPLPQPRADPADPRPLDRQVHRASRVRARGAQDSTGGHRHDDDHREVQTTQVYQLFIKATPGADLGRDHEARVHASGTSTAAARRTLDAGERWLGRSARTDEALGRRGRSSSSTRRAARARLALALQRGARARGGEPRHVGDRAAGRRRLPAHRRPRPARGRAEDGGERRPARLDGRPQRPQDAARDGPPLFDYHDWTTTTTATRYRRRSTSCSSRRRPEAIWEAITKPEFTERYFYGMRIETTPERRITHAHDGDWRRRPDHRVRPAAEARRTAGTRSGTPSCRPRSRAASRGRSSRRTTASRCSRSSTTSSSARRRPRRASPGPAGCACSAASRRCSRRASRCRRRTGMRGRLA